MRDISVRQAFDVQTSPEHLVSAGLEIHRLNTGVGFTIAGDRNENEANGSSIFGGSGLPDALQSSLEGTRGGVWVQDIYAPSSRVSVEPGLRVDWSTVNRGVTVSPRVAASYALGGGARLRGALGLYTQSPGYEKLVQSDYCNGRSAAREQRLHGGVRGGKIAKDTQRQGRVVEQCASKARQQLAHMATGSPSRHVCTSTHRSACRPRAVSGVPHDGPSVLRRRH